MRAKSELQSLSEELAFSPDADFMSRAEGGQVRTWTFAGTRLNRTYARNASSAGSRARFDALSVQAPADALMADFSDAPDMRLTDEELRTLVEGMKFAKLVPTELLRNTTLVRNFVVPVHSLADAASVQARTSNGAVA